MLSVVIAAGVVGSRLPIGGRGSSRVSNVSLGVALGFGGAILVPVWLWLVDDWFVGLSMATHLGPYANLVQR
jgi:hypothetical protein